MNFLVVNKSVNAKIKKVVIELTASLWWHCSTQLLRETTNKPWNKSIKL